MNHVQHLALGLDYLERAEKRDTPLIDLAIAHLLAASFGQGDSADATITLPRLSDETQVIGLPDVEPWTDTIDGETYAMYLAEDGGWRGVRLDEHPQPSWRRLYVERRHTS